ncbi:MULTISPECIES: YciI family protein [unclassified Rhizobium]|uniref:YciI family protein n=1 Tax=unclassified Rhizobium TaxID=2613769 RepID=UPI000CDF4207|nr:MULTISPECIES: YciI family protein [Rhizobium]AVA22395.1 YciI-related domain-containing protein [Rhizobium sp. NXC24]MDK4738551.1 YciI family protein [Rhizobium sp. CNPSo 3464]UWU19830.1 YciI family protein [Rhizobium tropici]
MLYAILCYNDEDAVFSWTKEEEQATMDRLRAVQAPLGEAGKLGPVARLMPTTAATTLRKGKNEPLVIDGPFAETKEQLLGFYVIDFETLDEAIEFSKKLAVANPGAGSYEIRPLYVFKPGTIAT